MRVLVTGASGFLGRAVVAAAVASGHEVVALVRPVADVDRLEWPEEVEIVKGDLRQPGPWVDTLKDVGAVVHLAAAKRGDLAQQFNGTVVATENLLEHLPMSSLQRFVHVSSFSVYDFASQPVGGAVTETTPVEPRPDARDAYTVTKIVQEQLVRDACEASSTSHIVLRPGAIYGPGETWGHGSALRVGGFDLIFSPRAVLRLTFVENCADAVVRAIEAPVPTGSTYNIVDDDLPTYSSYHRGCRKAGAATGRAVFVPWFIVSGVGRAVALLNRRAFRGSAKLPELLSHRRQSAAWKPFSYPNGPAKKGLSWTPRVAVDDGISETVKGAPRA